MDTTISSANSPQAQRDRIRVVVIVVISFEIFPVVSC